MKAMTGADQLVQACLRGDAFAWQRLVDEFAPVVVQAIVELGSSTGRQPGSAEIEQLTRTLFRNLRVDDFSLLREYRNTASFRTFLVGVTRRLAWTGHTDATAEPGAAE